MEPEKCPAEEGPTAPPPERRLLPSTNENEPDEEKAPTGPLRSHQKDESSDSYYSSSSDSPSPTKIDPADDILLAGTRILQNGPKCFAPGDTQQVAPQDSSHTGNPDQQETEQPTFEADYSAVDVTASEDEGHCTLDFDHQTDDKGEQVACMPP